MPCRVLPVGTTWIPRTGIGRLWARLNGYDRGSFYFLGLIEDFQAGKLGALRRFLAEFPAAVEQPELRYLMPLELVKAAMDFFEVARPVPATEPRAASSSSSPEPISGPSTPSASDPPIPASPGASS